MRRTSLLSVSILLATILIFTGCDLQTEPRQSVSPDVALGSLDGVEATLASTYYDIQRPNQYGRHLILVPDVLADHSFAHPQTSGRYTSTVTNTAESHMPTGFWTSAYETINKANLVMEGADEVEATQETRDQLVGESLFLRALTYHNLARVYAYEPEHPMADEWNEGVILRTEAVRDVADADERSRAPISEVYDQIIQDLNDALPLLNGNDRGKNFANYAATHALLARVHLYAENWQEAANHAEEAEAATDASLVDAESFQENNPFDEPSLQESIFELSYDPAAESVGANEAPVSILTPETWHDLVPSPELLDLYEDDDVRTTLYTDDGIMGEGVQGFNYIEKYTSSISRGDQADPHPIVRLPEMHLIQAEAYAELGQTDAALDALHELQETRNMEPADVDTPSEIIDEVMDERSRELAFEGHRFFDLKRRAMTVSKSEEVGTSPVPHDDFRILANLPTSQVDNIPPLNQNPGY